MKKYLIVFYSERNSLCKDYEDIVYAEDLESALLVFSLKKIHKHITLIAEVPSVAPGFSLFKNLD